MSTFSSPNVVTSGQTFYVDQNNTKSYLGPPIQNLSGNIGFNNSSGTGISITGGYETVNVPGLGLLTVTYSNIQNNYTPYSPNSTDCCPSPIGGWGGFAVSPSTLYTYAIVYKVDSGYTNANYMYRYEYVSNGGAYVGEGGVFNDANKVALGDSWFYAWNTFTTAATTNWIGYAASFYYRYAPTNDKLSVAKVLITPGNYSGLHPIYWPNKLTTRATTSVLSNLISNSSINANSLTYASDGTYSFNGAGNYISLPSTLDYTTTVSAFAWIKTTGAPKGGYHIIFGGQELEISIPTAGEIRTGVYTNARFVSNHGSGLTNGAWHYIGFTFDGSTKTSYIDGQNVGTQAVTGTLTSTVTGRAMGIFGQGDTTYGMNGFISNATIYNTSLSANQVQQNFNALRSRYGI